jgi:hypothetical protein
MFAASIKSCNIVHEAHKGLGGDGRVQAMPFRGAVEGITSIVNLETTTIITTTATKKKKRRQYPSSRLNVLNLNSSSSRDINKLMSPGSSNNSVSSVGGGESRSLSKFSREEKTIVTVKSSLSVNHQTRVRTVPVYKKDFKSQIDSATNDASPSPSVNTASKSHHEPSSSTLINLHKPEKDNVVVCSLIATGGGDGYVRIWKMTAKYSINRVSSEEEEKKSTGNKTKSGGPGGGDDTSTSSKRPFTFISKHGVKFEPLSKLTINLNATVRSSLPLPSFYQPRRQALADLAKRPCGVKAIALLSPIPSSKVNPSKKEPSSPSSSSPSASSVSSAASSFSSASSLSALLTSQFHEEEEEDSMRSENYLPEINVLVSTTGGSCLSYLPQNSPYNQAIIVEEEEEEQDGEEKERSAQRNENNGATARSTSDSPWKLQAITNAGHFKG